MTTRSAISLIACVLALSLIAVVSSNRFAAADAPAGNTASSSDAPSESAYPHYIRLRVVKVSPIEQIDAVRILKLDVERHYGKISTDSHERSLNHETQRFSILFPASLNADVREGDLIDYSISAYHKMGRD